MRAIGRLCAYLGLTGAVATAFFSIFVLVTLVIKGSYNPNTFVLDAPSNTADSGDARDTTDKEPEVASGAASGAQPAVGQVANPETTAVAAKAAKDWPDPVAGQKVFKKCRACHAVERDGKAKTGPNLWSIVNAGIAAQEGYKYSAAMASLAGKKWNPAFLDQYLEKPRAAIKGTKMAFSGLKKPADRRDVIAYLAGQSDTPIPPERLFALAAATSQAGATTQTSPAPVATEPAAPVFDPPVDPPAATPQEVARVKAAAAKLESEVMGIDYERARFHPVHFPPRISQASDEECLVCHQEIMNYKPRDVSPAGVKSQDVLAWYQTLDTYTGEQESFHFRHLQSPFAKQVMNLSCNFCHKGNDPREESADVLSTVIASQPAGAKSPFTLRKMVDPTDTCLRCHGAMPDPENIMGLSGDWHQSRGDFEDEETPNGCLSCHEETFRTVRHRVTYLKAASIEEAARASSDVCYGCHGGRKWYRISYPYARNPWPDMDEETPEWAIGRPTRSELEYLLDPEKAR